MAKKEVKVTLRGGRIRVNGLLVAAYAPQKGAKRIYSARVYDSDNPVTPAGYFVDMKGTLSEIKARAVEGATIHSLGLQRTEKEQRRILSNIKDFEKKHSPNNAPRVTSTSQRNVNSLTSAKAAGGAG